MNGILSGRSAAKVLGVVAMMIAVSGCDSDAASPSAPKISIVEKSPQDWYRGERPILRSQVDAIRSRIWVLTMDGIALYEASTGEEVAQIRLPGWLWVGEQYACPPDLAIGYRGEAVISSNVVPTLWRVDPVTLVASRHDLAIDDDQGRDIGITALVFSAQQGAYFAVSAAHGSLWRIDSRLARAQGIPLSAPLPKSCTLAMAPREPDRRAIRAVGMCVRGEKGDWTVAFAPDQRFGYVRPGQCNIS
jgi:hypothetical protein